MKAIIPNDHIANGKNYGGDKETVDAYNVIGLYRGKLVNVVTCRAYMGRSRSASAVYASIWVSTGPRLSDDGERVYFKSSVAGHGTASGYGYHKVSAAVGSAISSAGIELYGDVYGASHRWNHSENRENTDEEIAAIKRHMEKQRAHIGGVGDTAIESALMAIGRAVLGNRAKLILVHN